MSIIRQRLLSEEMDAMEADDKMSDEIQRKEKEDKEVVKVGTRVAED